MVSFAHSVARVAVWNLAGYQYVSPDRLARQVAGLAFLDAEMVVLVELYGESHLDALAKGLAEQGVDYLPVFVAQPHGLHIGILAKSGVTVENARLIPGTEGKYEKGRRALAFDTRIGGFSAHVLGLHLKSGRGAAEQALRDTQCRAIGAYVEAYRTAEGQSRRAILMMGDFNMIPGQDVSNFHHLGGDDVMDFVSSWDLQDRFSHILDLGRANLLDGFAISRTYSTRYIRGTLRLFPMHWTMEMGREAFRDRVSDHLPFTASFRIS
ncbi:GMP synthase [Palleronia sp. LCG004]|uniref:GMP synthase n=1 Tax=Palleronia sp. LCG004 TaxID=3079304 RepID=UPI00294380CE|nr:GMP synthase [Palleronia sp. LCG004]WOI55105.1 GMP synthase [Palleronia sp. LCG004]